MADNFNITQGSGTTMGSDDVGGVHYQKVKLFSPVTDSSSPIATNNGVSNDETFRVVMATDSIASVLVTGASGTIAIVGDVNTDAPDGGTPPVKVGGVARQTNPTPVSDGDRKGFSVDDLGRQLVRPIQVRDLVFTARLQKLTGSTFGTETTLLAASAGNYHDLVYLTATNDSTVAATVDLRSVTAGNVLMTFTIPTTAGGGQVTIQPPVPIPQDSTGNNWTIDCADITGTNLNFFALFTREP